MDPIKTAKDGASALGELIKIAGDNPEAKQAGRNIGKTAVIITQTVNNCLLPLAAVNFAVEKARSYFQERFPVEMQAKAANIPLEKLIKPKAAIAGPALQALAFAHEEENLREMYLELLAQSMNYDSASNAHPAFVEVIRQLESEEARLLKSALRADLCAIAEIRLHLEGQSSYVVAATNIMQYSSTAGQPVENARLPAMVDNWIRLGLVRVDYGKSLQANGSYDWVQHRPEYLKAKEAHTAEEHIKISEGVLTVTDFGRQFASVVGLKG